MNKNDYTLLEVLQEFLEKNIARVPEEVLCRSKEEARRLLAVKFDGKPIVKVFNKEERDQKEKDKTNKK